MALSGASMVIYDTAARKVRRELLVARVEGFYNKCNSPEDGRFCEGEDGPGRVRDKAAEGDGSKKNPIRTSDIEVAAAALAEGKHVELDQPDQVSTLLDKLSEMVEKAKAEGKDAKPFNLCLVSVPGTNVFCIGNKKIPRVRMPQLVTKNPVPGSAADKMPRNEWGEVNIAEGFVAHLAGRGISVNDESMLASHLRASQNEMNGAKVASLARRLDEGKKAPGTIWVTKDNYILDGHHTAAANVAFDAKDGSLGDIKVDIRRMDMNIMEALAAAKNYSASQGVPTAGV